MFSRGTLPTMECSYSFSFVLPLHLFVLEDVIKARFGANIDGSAGCISFHGSRTWLSELVLRKQHRIAEMFSSNSRIDVPRDINAKSTDSWKDDRGGSREC